ncbi:hypothetical protein CAPN008_11720 [Capnocytophaga canis]|uniref:hypothetical protein n=1 Tax=Capnocytophaga canis TaxID=1848903 RepID=UPI001AD04A0F|nr:hypothetical protein [Capnocytophaga canis]GIM61122.1 hypothetical protein CAPN008_11720 [Capnocytophaga canis]
MEKNERQVAQKAKQMLENSLRGNMSQFSEHMQGSKTKSIREAKASYSGKSYGEKGMPKAYYLRKVSIRMARHGFVQHYGVDTLRAGGERTRNKPRTFTYRYEVHKMRMQDKPFIDKAVEQSGVIDYVMKSVAEIRNEQVFVHVKNWLEK